MKPTSRSHPLRPTSDPPAPRSPSGTLRRTTALVLVLLLTLLAPGPTLQPAVAEQAETIVSLTFDDNRDSQWLGAGILADRGLPATFYVNSGRVDRPGYLSAEQLRAMEAAGHEIGGHTVTHLDLTTLEDAEARRQVCDDRAALTDMGLRVTSFAYPFSASDAVARAIVDECGYNSARAVGGIACVGCRTAETIPPRDPLHLETPISVKTETTLAALQGYVSRAREQGGGWINLVMHDVCEGCSTHAIAPSTLAALADWLVAEGIAVRTVDSVVGGPVRPVVLGPPGNNLTLRNASLEEPGGLGGAPRCWWFGGFGINTHRWSTLTGSDAHTGDTAYQVDVTGYVDGDRRLQQFEDTGACSLAVTPGHRYQIGAAYRTDARVLFAVRGRDASGYWRSIFTQPFPAGQGLPRTDEWAVTTWTTPPMPADIVAVSFYLSIRSDGYLATDSYSFVDVTVVDPGPDPGDPGDPGDPPGDVTAPLVAWQSPGEGSAVKGNLKLVVRASDDEELTAVQIRTPDGGIHTATAVLGKGKSPVPTGDFEVSWDTTRVPDGLHTFEATATDAAGNGSVAVRVLNVKNAKGGGARK